MRKWAGDDMIALQAEPLSAIQGFFEEYGNCIIQGCAVVPAAGGKYNIAPGLLGLSGTDADGVATFKVVPFSGVENVTLPLYFTLTHSVVDRVYGDGKVKPIAYDYRAAVSAVRPAAGVEFLELTTAGGRRFVDAVKITEKLDKVGNGKDVTVTFAQAATRENIASGEKLTTILGKIVRWLADLKALAFKDKVGKADLDAALQGEMDGKLNLSGGTMTAPLYVNYPASDIKARFAKTGSNDAVVVGINDANDAALCFLKISPSDVNYYNGISESKIWHAGNFNPATKEPVFTKNTAFNKNFGAVAGTVCQGDDVRLSDARPAKGGNADMVGGLRANMFARAYIPISFGVTGGDIITEEFITILNNHGAFNQPFWSSRGTWFFAGNKIISDTGVGRIHLAGASVEVISDASAAKFTARITTAAATPDSEPRRVFVYTKNDTSAAWSKLANSTDIPTSLPANGGDADTSGTLLITDNRPNHGNGLIMNQNIDLPGAPNRTDYFSYLRLLHPNPAGYFSELAMPFTNSTRMYFRNMRNGVLGNWNPIAFLSDIPVTLPASGGNADTVGGIGAASLMRKYTIIVGGDSSHFYPCTWIEGNISVYMSIHSATLPGSSAHNQNEATFLISSNGYSDMPISLMCLEHGMYQYSEVTVHSVYSGRTNGMNCIYLRGGMSYTVFSNTALTPNNSSVTHGTEVFGVMSDDGTVSTTNAIRIWSYTEGISWLGKQGEQAIQGNLTLNTSNASCLLFNRAEQTKGYIGCGETEKTDIFIANYVGGNNLKISDDGKNYSNGKEIATVDQITPLSGGAAPTAGQYVSGITVNDHAITVTKANLPTSNMGSVNNRDWNTILEPGFYYTSPQYFGTNSPGAYQYGLLTVERSNDSVVQTYYDGMYATIHYRVKSTGSSFSIWTEVAKKSDFNTANIVESEDKRFMSDAQEAKLDGGLEVAFAGVVDAEGEKVKWQGQFDSKKNSYGLFTISHNENDANLIVMVNSLGGAVGCAHSFTAHSFKIDSYAGAGGNSETGGSNSRGFQFVAYKL